MIPASTRHIMRAAAEADAMRRTQRLQRRLRPSSLFCSVDRDHDLVSELGGESHAVDMRLDAGDLHVGHERVVGERVVGDVRGRQLREHLSLRGPWRDSTASVSRTSSSVVPVGARSSSIRAVCGLPPITRTWSFASTTAVTSSTIIPCSIDPRRRTRSAGRPACVRCGRTRHPQRRWLPGREDPTCTTWRTRGCDPVANRCVSSTGSLMKAGTAKP